MEQQPLKVVWRFAGMRPGAPYVMDSGQDLMHKWPVDSWDTQEMVCISTSLIYKQNVLVFLDGPCKNKHSQ